MFPVPLIAATILSFNCLNHSECIGFMFSFLSFRCGYLSPVWAGWRVFRASQQQSVGLVLGHRHGDGHVVDHAVHTVDVGDELGDQALFGGVFGNAADRDDAVRR